MGYQNLIFLLVIILSTASNIIANNMLKNTETKTAKSTTTNKSIDHKTNQVNSTPTLTTPTTKPTPTDPTKEKGAEYRTAQVTNCSTTNCPAQNGVCSGTSMCVCRKEFANVPKVSKDTCSYKRKSQLTAFLLEFFLPFGVGHFYVGKWWLGLIKMICTLFAMITIYSFLICCLSCVQNQKSYAAYMFFYYFVPILASVWWLVDIILFGIDYFLDNNGVPLYTW